MIRSLFSNVSAYAAYNAVLMLTFALGPFLAWKCWKKLGIKSACLYYLIRYGFVAVCISFTVGKHPWGDIVGWYQHACWMVDDGLMPGHGFCSPYHLGFNGLLALAVWLWHSECAIVAVYTLGEAFGMFLVYRSLLELYGEKIAKRTVILALFSPIICASTFSTQDEPLLLCGVAAILWSCVKLKPIWSYVLAFVTFATSKILAPLYFVAFFVKGKWKGMLYLAVCLGAYWGIAWAMGVDPFDFRFGRSLGMDPERLDYTVDHLKQGTIWVLLPRVSPLIQVAVLAVCSSIVGLCFVKALFGEQMEKFEKIRLAIALSVVFYLVFNVTYSMNYLGYMVPVLPLMILSLNLPLKDRCFCVGVNAVVWVYFLIFTAKDGASRMIDRIDPSRIGLSIGLILVDLGMLVLVLRGVRRHLTSPLTGFKALFRECQ